MNNQTEAQLRQDHAADALKMALMAMSRGDYAEAHRAADEAVLILQYMMKDKKL